MHSFLFLVVLLSQSCVSQARPQGDTLYFPSASNKNASSNTSLYTGSTNGTTSYPQSTTSSSLTWMLNSSAEATGTTSGRSSVPSSGGYYPSASAPSSDSASGSIASTAATGTYTSGIFSASSAASGRSAISSSGNYYPSSFTSYPYSGSGLGLNAAATGSFSSLMSGASGSASGRGAVASSGNYYPSGSAPFSYNGSGSLGSAASTGLFPSGISGASGKSAVASSGNYYPSSSSNIQYSGSGSVINTAAPGSYRSGLSGASGAHATGTGASGRSTRSTGLSPTGSSARAKTTTPPSPTINSTSIPACQFTTTLAGPIDSSVGITGILTYCACGETIAGINIATSASSTTSFCAVGSPVPAGFTEVPSENGHIKLTPSQVAAQSSASAAAAKCTDGAFVDASCFNELDLPDYLLHWWTANSANCKSKNVGFAECFYALETKYAPSDCGQLNNDAECTQPIWSDFKNTTNGIQNFYVAWNLWNTAGFFLDMYTAIGNAEASCQAGIAAIIAQLDPPKKENVVLNDILDALSFGLSLYAEGSLLVKALLRSAPQTTGLLGKLFPTGTVDGEYQDWTVVSQNIGKATDAFRASVAAGLPLIQNNITTFISWSQGSGLSGDRPPLQGLTGSMTQAVNTYAIATIIGALGLVVSRAPNTDVHALQTNGSKLLWNTGCSGGYTNGICDTFFWDGTDTYGLTDSGHMTRNFHDDLTSFFTPPSSGGLSLTTGELLFSGAQRCYAATNTNGGANPSLNPTDPSQITCLSNLRVCTWDESRFGPFDKSCPNLPDRNAVLPYFGVSGCIGETGETTSIDVPRAYLGPGIYENGNNVADVQADSFCDNIDYKMRRIRV